MISASDRVAAILDKVMAKLKAQRSPSGRRLRAFLSRNRALLQKMILAAYEQRQAKRAASVSLPPPSPVPAAQDELENSRLDGATWLRAQLGTGRPDRATWDHFSELASERIRLAETEKDRAYWNGVRIALSWNAPREEQPEPPPVVPALPADEPALPADEPALPDTGDLPEADMDPDTRNHLEYQGAKLGQKDRASGKPRRTEAYGVGGVASKQRLPDLTPGEQEVLMTAYRAAYDAPPEPAPEPATRRPLGRQDYEDRVEARQERLEAAAGRAGAQAQARFDRAHKIGDQFELGQPIPDNSQGPRARRDQERIHQNVDKGREALQQAQELSDRAAAVGTGGISSDDPTALDKLRDKLAALEPSGSR